jgi:hypothetical protein
MKALSGLDGIESGVNPTEATLVADRSSSGAVYGSLAIGADSTGVPLYATNTNATSLVVFVGLRRWRIAVDK